MTYEEFTQEYAQFLKDEAAKSNPPSWFVYNLKSLLSKQITIEDWNQMQKYLRNNASDIETINEFLESVAKAIKQLLDTAVTKDMLSVDPDPDTIALRDKNGQVHTAMPTGNEDSAAVPLHYLISKLLEKVDIVSVEERPGAIVYARDAEGNPSYPYLRSTIAYGGYNIIFRDGDGRAEIEDPITAKQITNKGAVEKYVTEKLVTKADLVDGKVPSSQLPGYVDDVEEYDTLADFPEVGEDSKIYVAKDTNTTYRWSGTGYVQLDSGITLGETSSTAYAGDKGKANRDDINAILNGGEKVYSAIHDGAGNDITETYATKEEQTESLKDKVDKVKTPSTEVVYGVTLHTDFDYLERNPILENTDIYDTAERLEAYENNETIIGMTSTGVIKGSEVSATYENGVFTTVSATSTSGAYGIGFKVNVTAGSTYYIKNINGEHVGNPHIVWLENGVRKNEAYDVSGFVSPITGYVFVVLRPSGADSTDLKYRMVINSFEITTKGRQTTFELTDKATPKTAVERNAEGRFEVETPVNDLDSANKKYVDDNFQTKLTEDSVVNIDSFTANTIDTPYGNIHSLNIYFTGLVWGGFYQSELQSWLKTKGGLSNSDAFTLSQWVMYSSLHPRLVGGDARADLIRGAKECNIDISALLAKTDEELAKNTSVVKVVGSNEPGGALRVGGVVINSRQISGLKNITSQTSEWYNVSNSKQRNIINYQGLTFYDTDGKYLAAWNFSSVLNYENSFKNVVDILYDPADYSITKISVVGRYDSTDIDTLWQWLVGYTPLKINLYDEALQGENDEFVYRTCYLTYNYNDDNSDELEYQCMIYSSTPDATGEYMVIEFKRVTETETVTATIKKCKLAPNELVYDSATNTTELGGNFYIDGNFVLQHVKSVEMATVDNEPVQGTYEIWEMHYECRGTDTYGSPGSRSGIFVVYDNTDGGRADEFLIGFGEYADTWLNLTGFDSFNGEACTLSVDFSGQNAVYTSLLYGPALSRYQTLLYEHHVHIKSTSDTTPVNIRFDISTESNTIIDSIQDLTTYLKNRKVTVSGFVNQTGATELIVGDSITNTSILYGPSDSSVGLASVGTLTIEDVVTAKN